MTFESSDTIRLYDLIELVGGGTPKTSFPEYWNGNIPWLSVKDFANDEKYVYKSEKSITNEGLQNSSTKLLEKDDIIISARGTVGELAVLSLPMTFNQSCYGIRPKSNLINKDFLFYLLKNCLTTIKNNSHGSVFDTITRDTFKNISVKLPPLSQQKKIADILSSLDDLIAENRKINEKLEEMAQAIFDNSFHGIVGKNRTIGEYITPKKGKGLLSKDAINGKVPVIAGGLQPATMHNVANTSSPVITISASGANAGFVNLWHVPVWSSDSSFVDSLMTKDIYFWYILLKKRQQEIYDSQTGSAQPHIYPKHIMNMIISELDTNQIELFTKVITPFFERIGNNIDEIQRLESIRDTLLPKLMSGELSVSDSPDNT